MYPGDPSATVGTHPHAAAIDVLAVTIYEILGVNDSSIIGDSSISTLCIANGVHPPPISQRTLDLLRSRHYVSPTATARKVVRSSKVTKPSILTRVKNAIQTGNVKLSLLK